MSSLQLRLRALASLAFSACLTLLCASALHAGTVSYKADFNYNDLSMWSGKANSSIFSVEKFVGAEWNASGGIGGIERTIVGDFGLEVSGATHGKVGLDLGFHATSGTINAKVPVSLDLTMPDVMRPGESISVNAKVNVDGLGFSTLSPTFGFRAGLALEVFASATAQACLFGCLGFENLTLLDINTHPELLAFNMAKLGTPGNTAASFDGQLRVLGQEEIAGFNFKKELIGKITSEIPLYRSKLTNEPILTLSYGNPNQTTLLPEIRTTSATGAGGISSASGQANLLGLKVDVGQLATQLSNGYIPPLAGNLGTLAGKPPLDYIKNVSSDVKDMLDQISYNLVTAKIGAAVGFQQDFSLAKPVFNVDLKLDQTGQIFHLGAATGGGVDTNIQIPLTLLGSASPITFTPTLTLAPLSFSNTTSLFIDPTVDISAFGLGLGSLQIGPLYEYSNQFATPRIPVYSTSFNLEGNNSATLGSISKVLDSSPTEITGQPGFQFAAGSQYFNHLFHNNHDYSLAGDATLTASTIRFDGNDLGQVMISSFDQSLYLDSFNGIKSALISTRGSGLSIQNGGRIVGIDGKIDGLNISNGGIISAGDDSAGRTGTLTLANTSVSGGTVEVARSSTLNLNDAQLHATHLSVRPIANVQVSGNSSSLGSVDNKWFIRVNSGNLSLFGPVTQILNDVTGILVYSNAVLGVHNSITGGRVYLQDGATAVLDGAFLDRVSVRGWGGGNNLKETAAGTVVVTGPSTMTDSKIYVGTSVAPGRMLSDSLRASSPAFLLANPAASLTMNNSDIWVANSNLEIRNFATLILNGSELHLDGYQLQYAPDGALQAVAGKIINGGVIISRGNSDIGDKDGAGHLYGAEVLHNLENSGLLVESGQLEIRGSVTNEGYIGVSNGAILDIKSMLRQNLGEISIDGELQLGESLKILGGRVHGTGQITGNVENIAGDFEATGLVFMGDYRQERGGRFLLTLDPFANDPFWIQGLADLDGTLFLDLLFPAGFNPFDGFSLQTLRFNRRAGKFNAYQFAAGDTFEKFFWDTIYSPTGLTMILRRQFEGAEKPDLTNLPASKPPVPFPNGGLVQLAQVPEPGSLALMGAGIVALALLRRRHLSS